MEKIARFYAVDRERFVRDWPFGAESLPERVRLPRRATRGSAGYDFYSPLAFRLEPGQSLLIPTGVRARIDEGWVLLIVPRSGMGFRYRLQLDNTIGVIDADYFYADNGGHIFLRITNDSRENRTLNVREGEAFAQGIFVPFGIVSDDEATALRRGGLGSTDRREDERSKDER